MVHDKNTGWNGERNRENGEHCPQNIQKNK